MKAENTSVQMRKGILEYCVLSIISKGEVYASDMLDQLHQAGFMVVDGTMYPLLTRLKNGGMLEYRWEESTTGPPRKYYKLTIEGQALLAELQRTWDEISLAVLTLTQNTNNSF